MAMLCKNCGAVGAEKMQRRGTATLELLLWMCFLLPGLIYSIWRWMNKYKTCSTCGGSKVTEFEPSQMHGGGRKSGSPEKQAKR